MTTHDLKILQGFADAIISGVKLFEIRKNDRGYQKGDHIIFKAIDGLGLGTEHEINSREYEITYVMNGWGLKNGFVVLGIKQIIKADTEAELYRRIAGMKKEHDGCVSCRFEDKKEHEDPCRRCSHNFTDKWEAKE